MSCNKCSGGWVKIGRGYNRCECIREKIVEMVFEESTAPKEFYKFKEDLDDQKSFNVLGDETSYLEILNSLTSKAGIKELFDKTATIVFKGNPGSGKTQLASTIALEIAKSFDLYSKELEPIYFYFLRMAQFKNLMFSDESKNEVLEKVKRSKVLIIDDLGVENYENSWTLENLSEILREFQGVKIITTNLAEDIHKFYKKRDKRLTDVLVNSEEKYHNQKNCLFYEIGKQESRRVKHINSNLFL